MRVGKRWVSLCKFLCLTSAMCLPSFAGVSVSSPANATVTNSGSASVTSPVHFVATGTSPACAKGVASIGIYTAPFKLAYVVNGANLDKSLSLNAGTYNVAVQEWDHCGQSAKAMVKLVVGSGSGSGSGGSGSNHATPVTPMVVKSLQSQKGWSGFALLPPAFGICQDCTSVGPKLQWSWTQKVASPSMDSLSTKSVYGSGTVQWGDVLWNNHLIGDFSSQDIHDSNHTIVPKYHYFTYDVYFFVKNVELSQALEFDINQFVGGKKFIWGHECRVAGGHQWDIWDNPSQHWYKTGVPCNPISNAWNHLTIQAERTTDDHLIFKSITLNGKTATLNHVESPTTTAWHGITINYQIDGDRYGHQYTVYLDKLTFTMQ